MKLSRLLALFIIFTLLVSFIPANRAGASQAYTEKLSVSIAGSDALWYMTFGGVNVSSAIAKAESSTAVDWYNLTVLKTTGWTLDSQVFGPNGFNLIQAPFIPSQGAFLTMGAGSFSEASHAAASFDSLLYTTFTSYSNATGRFVFYSPISFSSVVPSTILTMLPTKMGGFAVAVSSPVFASSQSPIVTLSGKNEGSSFSHVLSVGSISTSALSSSSTPNLLKYFGTSITSLRAANKSTSSGVSLRFLDGTINSSDHAAIVTPDSYSLSLSPNHALVGVNLTVSQIPTPLFVERVLDKGVLMPNQNVSVTISMSNSEGPSNITTHRFQDDWWKSYGFFKLVGPKNSTIPAEFVMTGKSQNPTYVLQYTGSTPQQVTVPPAQVEYTYTVGARTFRAQARSNPTTLSLGTDRPVILAYVAPAETSNYGDVVGKTQEFTVFVKNIGTLTASSVVVAGQQVGGGGLVPGGSTSVSIPLTSPGLASTNSTKAYVVTYSTSGNQAENTETNPIAVYFSHSGMTYGLPTLSLRQVISHPRAGVTNLTIVLTAQTRGSVNSTSFLAQGTLPSGLQCGKVIGPDLTCAGGRVTLPIHSLGTDKMMSSLQFNLSSPTNYVFSPFSFRAESSGFNLTGASDGIAIPAGIILSKQFSASGLFGNMTAVVKINALNPGPYHILNATIASLSDSFDSLSPTFVSTRFLSDVPPGSSLNQTYHVAVSKSAQAVGNWSSSRVTLSFYMGGALMSLNVTGPQVSVFQAPSVAVRTSSSPTEGKSFSVSVTVTNPSSVTVSDVRYTVKIPSSVTLSGLRNATFSGGSLVMAIGQLGPHRTYSANVTAQATSGTALLFSKGILSFTYSGVTVYGTSAKQDVVVGEDVLARYTVPTLLVLVAVIATAFYVRRKASISLGSQQ